MRRDEAQVDASLGRKDGMGIFEVSAMFAHGASGHRLASGERGVKCGRQAEASLPAGEKPWVRLLLNYGYASLRRQLLFELFGSETVF